MNRCRRARRALAFVLLGAAALIGWASGARADNGAAMNVKIWGAVDQVDQPVAGQCTWTVTFNVSIFNISHLSSPPGQELHISAVAPAVTADALNLDPSTQITVLNDGGLHSGVTIPNDGGLSHPFMGYRVQFTVPCGTANGSAGVSVTDEIGSNTSTAPYVKDGVVQPSVSPAAVAVTAVGGVLLLYLLTTRRRARDRAE